MRLRFGLIGAAGGAVVALGSASPDVGINAVSAITGSASIGLGSMLGSTVVSIPITVVVAYVAVRRNRRDNHTDDGRRGRGELLISRAAVTIDALP